MLILREVFVGCNNELYGIKIDFGWSIVGGSDVRSGCFFCYKVVVKEIFVVIMIDIV